MILLRISFQTVFLCSLLLHASSPLCVGPSELLERSSNLRRRLQNTVMEEQPPPRRTCAQAAQETSDDVNSRALAPWRYSLDLDQDRVPERIMVAECLCEGCVLNGKQDHSYNSKPLTVDKLVYRKTHCKHQPNKYKLRKEIIKVSVGCVCVTPKHAKTTTSQ